MNRRPIIIGSSFSGLRGRYVNLDMSVAASCELLSSRVPDICNHTSSSTLRSTSDTKSAAKHYQTMTELDKLENCINKLMDRSSAAGLTNKMPTNDDKNGTVSLRKKHNSTKQPNDNAGQTPDDLGSENGNRLSISEEKITLTQSSNTQQLVRKNSLRMVTRSPVIRRRSTPISELDRTWALNQCEVCYIMSVGGCCVCLL